MNQLNAVKYAKDKVKNIKEHEAVSNFCGSLTFPQQVLFGITLTIWIVFNTVSMVTTLMQVFGEENFKIVTSEVPLQDEDKLPNIGFMACASTPSYYYAAGIIGNLSATSTFHGPAISTSSMECKTFTSKSKFNDYTEGIPVRCCGLTLPRQLYELPEGISSMQQNKAKQDVKLDAKNTVFVGIFSRELKSGETALNALDPSVDFKVDGRAAFSDDQLCDKEKATTDFIELIPTTYFGLKFTKTKDEREISTDMWKKIPPTVNVALKKSYRS